MPEMVVREEDRPSFGKYVLLSVAVMGLITWLIVTLTQDSTSQLVGIIGLLTAAVANVAVVFVMVQSLVDEWFAAAEIVENGTE